MTTLPVSHSVTGLRTPPKPTEVHDAVDIIARLCTGFAVDQQSENDWVCIPWGYAMATGYGSTVFSAIADAARQLVAQGVAR